MKKIFRVLDNVFFLETIFSSFLLNINPFDQPAVEQGKVLTKKYLKK